MPRPTFATLESHYPIEDHDCPDIKPSPNQCAVRMSRALIAAGIPMDGDYPGNANLCRHRYARGAQDLGAFLKKKWGVRDLGYEAPGSVPSSLKGVPGVVLFIDIPNFSGQGHIDLWNGAKAKTGEYWDAKTIWFWKLPAGEQLREPSSSPGEKKREKAGRSGKQE